MVALLDDQPTTWRCRFQTRNTSYRLTDADKGQYVYRVRFVRWRDTEHATRATTRSRPSSASPPAGARRRRHADADADAAPTPTPTPVADGRADARRRRPLRRRRARRRRCRRAAQVLHETARSRRIIKPFPVVRMRGG